MNRMGIRIKFTGIALLVLLCFFLYGWFGCDPRKNTVDQGSIKTDNLLIILVNPIDFMCQNCSASFFSLCDSLRERGLDTRVVGIFTIPRPSDDGSVFNDVNILKKQIRGFVKGNRIQFPVLLDDLQVFTHSPAKSSRVILLNILYGIVQEWQFPVDIHQLNEIMALLK
jgi:hypothetical protein